MALIRIFLVDDHTILRNGIRKMLGRETGLEVVGEAANGLELLDQLPGTPTDVVLLDGNMPGMSGLETLAHLRADYPAVRVLVLSMLEAEQYVWRMLDAGALGYVLKSSSLDEIVQGIRMVAQGRPFLSTELGMAALRKPHIKAEEEFSASGEEFSASGEEFSAPTISGTKANLLSKREREVLQLIADGLTNAEIADKLFTSKRTIETHRQNIIEKTRTKNTASLIRFAVTAKLVS
jgi:DNA-binding NarL/FixJ family response regulator